MLTVAVFVVYANVYGNEFLYDDEFLIQKNSFLREWSGIYKSFLMSSTGGSGGVDSFYRPLQGFFYTLIFQIFGESTLGFHLLNVSLHAANAGLLFYLGQSLGFSRWGSGLAALLWSVHPVHTEAITYMSGTADPLYTFFSLIGLILLARSFKGRDVALALMAYVLALLSKESAIVFPALAVACRFQTSLQRWNWRSYIFSWPLWLLAIFYLVARKTVLNFDNTFHFYKTANIYTENVFYRFLTFLATLPSYGQLLLYPSGLHIDRNFPVFIRIFDGPVMAGLGLVLLAVGILWRERRQAKPLWSFAVMWFTAAHVPNSGVALPVNALILEHWLYLPTVGLFLCLGEALHSLPLRLKTISVWAAGMVVLLWGAVTWMQNEVWANPIQFYSRILAFEPRVARVQNNLAMAYSDLGQDDLALQHYNAAIRLSDVYSETHHNMALLLLRRREDAAAIEHLQRALAINPDFFRSASVLAQIYEGQNDLEKSRFYENQARESLRKLQH